MKTQPWDGLERIKQAVEDGNTDMAYRIVMGRCMAAPTLEQRQARADEINVYGQSLGWPVVEIAV